MTNKTSQYISLTEAAKKLGYAESSTLRRRAHDGGIPGAIKIGKTWGIPLSWIEEEISLGEQSGKGWRKGKTRNND